MTSDKSRSPDSSHRIDAPDQPIDSVRRRLFGGAVAASVLGVLPLDGYAGSEPDAPMNVRFTHGVASGDPLADRVILWTRVRAQDTGDKSDVPVSWEVATDDTFSTIVASGKEVARRANDFCVKVDAIGLKPATSYAYRFKAFSASSLVGRTRTLPVDKVDRVRLAVFSCANYETGHFNVYAEAVKRLEKDPGCYDALLHLGDYIYEMASGSYPRKDGQAPVRLVNPPQEALKLVDYRSRYAQCRQDPSLQRLHQLAPMIAVWDDHEFANDAWKDGAGNHQEDKEEGTFKKRKNAAARAWWEWLPVRGVRRSPAKAAASSPDALPEEDAYRRLLNYRSFDFGNLLSLHMLDTRLRSRQKQLAMTDYLSETAFDNDGFDKALNSPDRDLLGSDQWTWLEDRMKQSTATWQVLGQQVLMARMHVPSPLMLERLRPGLGLSLKAYENLIARFGFGLLRGVLPTSEDERWLVQPSIPYNLGAWDGYPVARERLLATARKQAKNLVVLAGDTHNAWASDLEDGEGRTIGVEFATPSVSSPGLEEYLPGQSPDEVAAGFKYLTNSLRFAETSRRGYLEITATSTECRGNWILVDTVKKLEYTATVARSLRVLPGEGHRKLIEV